MAKTNMIDLELGHATIILYVAPFITYRRDTTSSASAVILSCTPSTPNGAEKSSLYPSANEFQSLIKQVLSWDIRSISQRSRTHHLHKKEIEVKDNRLPESKGDASVESEVSDGNEEGLTAAPMSL
ncbi:hypothetical protein ACLOJK_002812 [Asimina triloba]